MWVDANDCTQGRIEDNSCALVIGSILLGKINWGDALKVFYCTNKTVKTKKVQ